MLIAMVEALRAGTLMAGALSTASLAAMRIGAGAVRSAVADSGISLASRGSEP